MENAKLGNVRIDIDKDQMSEICNELMEEAWMLVTRRLENDYALSSGTKMVVSHMIWKTLYDASGKVLNDLNDILERKKH